MSRDVLLNDFEIDPALQLRVKINDDVVEEYSNVNATVLPPIVAFTDSGTKPTGIYWIADGWHRFHAAIRRGDRSINCAVMIGTKRDALLYAAGANVSHGLRRTNEDKKRAVLTLLDDPEWSKMSDRAIAEIVAVSHVSVAKFREALFPAAPKKASDKPTVRVGKNGKKYVVKDKVYEPVPKKPIKPAKPDAPIGEPPVAKPVVERADAPMPESYVDTLGVEVPESLYPVWRQVHLYHEAIECIRVCGIRKILLDLLEVAKTAGNAKGIAACVQGVECVDRIIETIDEAMPREVVVDEDGDTTWK